MPHDRPGDLDGGAGTGSRNEVSTHDCSRVACTTGRTSRRHLCVRHHRACLGVDSASRLAEGRCCCPLVLTEAPCASAVIIIIGDTMAERARARSLRSGAAPSTEGSPSCTAHCLCWHGADADDRIAMYEDLCKAPMTPSSSTTGIV